VHCVDDYHLNFNFVASSTQSADKTQGTMAIAIYIVLCGQIIGEIDMGLDRNDFENEMDLILSKNHLPIDTHGIKQAIETTQDDLRSAIMNGQANLMLELDNRLRVLSARAFGADVSESKSAIDKAELEKVSIAKELELLREIKKQKNLQAGRAEQLFFRRMERVADAQLEIEIATTRLTNARVTAKESRAKLQALLDAKQKETTRQYKQYELSRY
jgi:DNA polymerase III delta prime subunit